MKASDKAEFLKAYKKIHEPLMRFCIVKSRGIMDPEDLANDVLLIGLEKYSELKDKKALLSYLFTTANNISLNQLRRKKFSGPYDETKAKKMPDSHQYIESSADMRILYEAMEQLPEVQKEALILFAISDLPISEIMVIQNAGESSVKQRIKRGREKLAAILQENDRKIAVAVAISLTTNAFSMSNLDQYFQAFKMLPLPLSEAEAIAKINQFQLTSSAVSSLKTGVSTAIKKVMGALVIGGGMTTIVLFSGATLINDENVADYSEKVPVETANLVTSDDHITVKSKEIPLEEFKEEYDRTTIESAGSLLDSNTGIAIPAVNWSTYKHLLVDISDQKEMIVLEPTPGFQKKEDDLTMNDDDLIVDLEGINLIEVQDIGENIVFRTWDQNVMKVESTIKVECKKEEDKEIILRNIKLEASKKGDHLILKLNSKQGKMSLIQIGNLSKGSIQFENGEKAKYKELKQSYVITIPSKMNLKLNSNYANIDMAPIEGDLSGNLYESKFNAGNINGDVNMSFKYSEVKIGDIQDGKINIYETKLDFLNCDHLKLNSKYSKVAMKDIETLLLTSYEDKINTNHISNLEADLRYTNLKSNGDIGQLKLQAYESEVEAKNIENFDLTLFQYSSLSSTQVDQLTVGKAYESEVIIGVINAITVDKSLYTNYKISKLMTQASISSYEDNLTISEVVPYFDLLKFSGKYSNYEIAIDPTSAYELSVKSHYGNVNYNSLNMSDEHFTDKNDYINLTGKGRGEINPTTTIAFDCYESSILFK